VKQPYFAACSQSGERGNGIVKRTGPSVVSLLAAVYLLFPIAVPSSFGADLDKLETYVTLKTGIYSPQGTPFKDFDQGFNGEVSTGSYVASNFSMELGIGYFESKGSGVIVAPGNQVIPADAKISVIPITVNGKYLVTRGSLEPYAEAGVGVYVADGELSGGGIDLSDRYTNLGVFLGLGANIHLSKKLFLGVEGRYLWVGEPEFHLGQVTRKVEIDGFTATANLGYKFDFLLPGN